MKNSKNKSPFESFDTIPNGITQDERVLLGPFIKAVHPEGCPEGVSSRRTPNGRGEKRQSLAPKFALFLLTFPWSPISTAHQAYQKKDFSTAQKILEQKQIDNPNEPLLNYNLGTTYYKQKEYDLAKESFARAASGSFAKNASLREKSLFNLGNCSYQKTLKMLPDNWASEPFESFDTIPKGITQDERDPKKPELEKEVKEKAIKEIKESIESYEKVLKINKRQRLAPENRRVEQNKKKANELLQKLMKCPPKKEKQKKDDKKEKDKKQQQQEQKNNQQQQQKPKSIEERKKEVLLSKLEKDEKKLQKKLLKKKAKSDKKPKNNYQKPW